MVELNGTLLAQFLNFFILVAILAKFAYKPMLKVLQERQEKIASDLGGAEQARQEAEQLLADYKEQLKNARVEAQAIVDKAMKQAEQEAQAQLEAVRAQIAKEKAAAQAEIAKDREAALQQMREEVITLSIAAAGKLLEKNLDHESNSRLVADCITKLDSMSAGK